MEKNMMESPESLNPLQQFKFDLRTLVTKLSALKELGGDVPPDDIEQYKDQLNKLDEVFEEHKSAFDDDELKETVELLDKAESLLVS